VSYKVAVATEDHTLDQYIVGPVVRAVMAAIGKPKAVVHVITNPRIRGFDDLRAQACEIVAKYAPIMNVLVFAIDLDCQDGQEGRPDRLVRLGNALQHCALDKAAVLTVGAVNEVEIWALWGSRGELPDGWETVRAECHPKEIYFEPLMTREDLLKPDRGRKRLIESSLAGGLASLVQGCGEIGGFRDALENHV